MHIAAATLSIDGTTRHPGAEVPEFATWSPAVQHVHLSRGLVVYVPVAALLAVVPRVAEAAHRKGRS